MSGHMSTKIIEYRRQAWDSHVLRLNNSTMEGTIRHCRIIDHLRR
jgi:hypothetical protein